MNNYNFHKLADKLFLKIEKEIDRYCGKEDIDCEIHYNMITIDLNNKNKIIINRQEALHQIWLATKNCGYHFSYIQKQWICNRTKKNFWDILEQSCSKQTNSNIVFSVNR
ncbi:iron donor protein CyaY [Buchnera aphidicola]|uniref:Iron-sulfur cluster assembly protein CyaY n=1 Tax=Buchnera aphidicola subsp. Melaphis rhois TaxID=118103 RepID=A0A4D6Y1Q5_BUCMH|nr:iron donor protein CyaY [Buchnera aphidicola]QCI23542.1 iron donor protein CyaY [Buchnera aphidicola (Melaphis rhois)]